MRKRSPAFNYLIRFSGLLLPAIAVLLLGHARAEEEPPLPDPQWGGDEVMPTYVIKHEPEESVLYHNGERVRVEIEERWKLICGSAPDSIDSAGLEQIAETHISRMERGPLTTIDSGVRDRGLNIIFYTDASVPAAAQAGLALAEQYLEEQFGDNITVGINVSFQNMGGGGVIGATSSNYVSSVSWSSSRAGLINGMDDSDLVQEYLPTTNLPVRWNGSSSAVSYAYSVDWTRANYNATVGTTSGTAASMTYNTQFNFDYDPSNGVPYNAMSFVDVAVHEVGHALGFTSSTDWGSRPKAMDLFRFQRTDGAYDYNPDSFDEFTTAPRLIDYNNPDDQHLSDLITVEYRMADGSPWQASHFREQTPMIGLMDPATSNGNTRYPDYFTDADRDMFDAIGYDYPACFPGHFLEQPEESQWICPGETLVLSVEVSTVNPAFQWRVGTIDLVDDGVRISGATTDTLTITNVSAEDAAPDYHCMVTNLDGGCSASSEPAEVMVREGITVTGHPQSQDVAPGGALQLEANAFGENPLSYQWRFNGEPLSNGGGVFGATTGDLLIIGMDASRAGNYDCVVSNVCGPVATDVAVVTVGGVGVGGDMDCNGVVNFDDIEGFVAALVSPENYEGWLISQGLSCAYLNGDFNDDDSVNFDDINLFVEALAGE